MLGARGRVAWDEIWPIIGPQIEQVMGGGGATWHENHLVPITRHGRLEEVYWTYSYGPIDDETAPGGVGGVLVLCTETTAHVLAAERMRAADARWRALFEQAPGFMCILQGPEHRYEYANARYMSLVGHRPIVGKTLLEALPELEGQGILELLDRVFRTGEVYTAEAAPVQLPGAGGGRQLFYLDFVYQPIRDDGGSVTGIFVEGIRRHRTQAGRARPARADRRKDEFLAILSHELRNPLAPLRNAAAMLRSAAANPGDARLGHPGHRSTGEPRWRGCSTTCSTSPASVGAHWSVAAATDGAVVGVRSGDRGGDAGDRGAPASAAGDAARRADRGRRRRRPAVTGALEPAEQRREVHRRRRRHRTLGAPRTARPYGLRSRTAASAWLPSRWPGCSTCSRK